MVLLHQRSWLTCTCTSRDIVGENRHYDDVIMSAIASQITSLTIVYSTVYPSADQSKHQSSASLAFVWGIHRGPVNSPHKWPVTRKMFPFDDIIMEYHCTLWRHQMETFTALLSHCVGNPPITKGRLRGPLMFLWCQSKLSIEILDWPVIRDAMTLIWRRRNALYQFHILLMMLSDLLVRGDHFGYGLGHWEKALHNNAFSHWLSPYSKCPGRDVSSWPFPNLLNP